MGQPTHLFHLWAYPSSFIVCVGLPTTFIFQHGLAHPSFNLCGPAHHLYFLMWAGPPNFISYVGLPTIFFPQCRWAHTFLSFTWASPPVLGHPTPVDKGCPTLFFSRLGWPTIVLYQHGAAHLVLMTFLLGTLTLSPQKGNFQHQPFPGPEFNHFG